MAPPKTKRTPGQKAKVATGENPADPIEDSEEEPRDTAPSGADPAVVAAITASMALAMEPFAKELKTSLKEVRALQSAVDKNSQALSKQGVAFYEALRQLDEKTQQAIGSAQRVPPARGVKKAHGPASAVSRLAAVDLSSASPTTRYTSCAHVFVYSPRSLACFIRSGTPRPRGAERSGPRGQHCF